MNFLQNKYTKTYFNIIDIAKQRKTIGYTETHHIIPVALNGSNDKSNLVDLTAREHFICHLLLTKMIKSKTQEWYSMVGAIIMMQVSSLSHQRYTARIYESLKTAYGELQSLRQTGENNSNFNNCWVSDIDQRKSFLIPKEEVDIYFKNNKNLVKKRIIDFDKYFEKIEKKLKKKEEIKNKSISLHKQNEKDAHFFFNKFREGNYQSIRKFYIESGYSKSIQMLKKIWRLYITDYSIIATEGKFLSSKFVNDYYDGVPYSI